MSLLTFNARSHLGQLNLKNMGSTNYDKEDDQNKKERPRRKIGRKTQPATLHPGRRRLALQPIVETKGCGTVR
jgi:hypothetical protein